AVSVGGIVGAAKTKLTGCAGQDGVRRKVDDSVLGSLDKPFEALGFLAEANAKQRMLEGVGILRGDGRFKPVPRFAAEAPVYGELERAEFVLLGASLRSRFGSGSRRPRRYRTRVDRGCRIRSGRCHLGRLILGASRPCGQDENGAKKCLAETVPFSWHKSFPQLGCLTGKGSNRQLPRPEHERAGDRRKFQRDRRRRDASACAIERQRAAAWRQ